MKRSLPESALSFLIRILSDGDTAERIDRYAQTRYPEDTARLKRLRFQLRSLVSLRFTAIWLEQLDRHPDLGRCLVYEKRMVEKMHRPYRRSGLPYQQQLDLLLDHVRISSLIGWSEFIARTYETPLEIACISDRTGQPLHIHLGRPAQFDKEGELALRITDSNCRYYNACFSFRETNGVRELDVGCLQGSAADDGRQKIRDLTRNLHGLRPRSLMLEALRSIAAASGCTRLRVVGNGNHIYRSLRKRRKIAFDYDGFCAESGESVADGGDWLLPVTGRVRPLSEVPSKKRAETARRRALLQSVDEQIRAAVRAGTQPDTSPNHDVIQRAA